MTNKPFSIGALLSVTTRILCVDDIGEMYELLTFMCGESPFTHQLKRFANEATPYLYEQHPWLHNIKAQRVVGDDCLNRVAKLAKRYGEFHEVSPIHHEDHESINPYDELKPIAPHLEVIEIDITPDEPSAYGDISWKVE